MSATAIHPAAPLTGERGRLAVGDRTVIALLGVGFAAMVALTWRRWGMPEGDSGAELTTADLIKHGAVAYRDVRYFYGPLGLYSLALAFKVFGTSFTTAYGFGLVQAGGILGAFYALARQWLPPLVAGLTTLVLLAIGFSGTSFNFVLPHTNSATFGILTLLLMLLALRRENLIAAGCAAGLVGLTRPEFFAVAAGVAAAYLVACWRSDGWRVAIRALWPIALPGVMIPVAVFGWFAAQAGVSRLLWQNLWPVDFLKVAGFHMQSGWMPFDLPSLFGLLARAGVYVGAVVAVVLCAEGVSRRRGFNRAGAGWPLVTLAAVLGLFDLLLRVTGGFVGERSAIEGEIRHLIVGMSWLPALGLATFVWASVRLIRRAPSPLGGRWAADYALIVAAVGLGLRAYNAFTAEGSYAPYYAAPLVLILGILHFRAAQRRPQAASVLIGALGIVAAGLAAYSVFGLYRHLDVAVHTPRGTFMTTPAGAAGLQRAVRAIDAETGPSQRILAAPLDGGLYFMANRRPAIYELSVLPGLLYSRSGEETAIAGLRRYGVGLAVVGARDFSLWGTPRFGIDYDKELGAYLRRHAVSERVVGSFADPAAGTYPSKGFQIIRLRR